MLSRFLPQNYDLQKPVALIAGGDLYPVLTAERFRQHAVPLKLIAFNGETREDLIESFPKSDRVVIKVGQLGKMLKALQKFEVGYALMAGQITPKRLFRGLYPDLKAIHILTRLNEKNADTIFGAIANEIEKIGVVQLDARAFLDSELAQSGLMAGKQLKEELRYIQHGIHIAKEIARLDIGQGVVVRSGTVLAVEAFEGTDAMLRRAGAFKTDHALFIKTVKPHQDYRFDVPVFGMRTLETLTEAGIHFAALEADNTIILEKEKVLRAAAKKKIQIYGYDGDTLNCEEG